MWAPTRWQNCSGKWNKWRAPSRPRARPTCWRSWSANSSQCGNRSASSWPREHEIMAALYSHKRGTVLVADDDPVMRLLMLEMLAQVGLDAVEAGDGEEALAVFDRIAPDLVLLDVEMPRLDGFGVCRAIRAREHERSHGHGHSHAAGVPIIMVTGGDDLEAVTQAYEVGATDFVSKPINWPILGHRVLYVLRASDAIAR